MGEVREKVDGHLFTRGVENTNMTDCISSPVYKPVLRIRIRIQRIHMFLGLQDQDPLVRGMDPDPAPDPNPSIIMHHHAKIVRKTLIPTI